MKHNSLAEAIGHVAQAAHKDGIASTGDVVTWVRANVKYTPEQEFFLCFLVTAHLADIEAQAEGYKSQAHRAAERAAQ